MRRVPKAEAEELVFPAQDGDDPASAKAQRAELKRQVDREKAKPHPSQTYRWTDREQKVPEDDLPDEFDPDPDLKEESSG